MFKVGLDLPTEVAKEAPKQKKKNQEVGGDELQRMLDELKPKPASTKTKPARSEPRDEPAAPLASEKSHKKAKDGTKNAVEDAKKTLKPKPARANASDAGSKQPEAVKSLKSAQNSKPVNDSKPKNELQPAVKRRAEEAQRPAKKLTPLQLKMQQKLSGARFRWINEQLYTTDSQHAFDIFQKQPEVFKEYHDGFRQQVEQWPENPVLSFVQQFQDRLAKPLNAPGGLPGDKPTNTVVVSDMGCGEAELALRLGEQQQGKRRRPRFDVHSFDMTKANERITVADIAHVPLPDESCHVVVYCLALMGTNLTDFINEGIRILKPHGLVWIAEIKSRFEGNSYDEFVQKLKDMGLYHRTTDDSNKMFVKFEFVKLPHKLARAQNTHPDLALKPCIYKRR